MTDDTHSPVLSPHGAVLLVSLVCEALLVTQVHVILELTGQPVILMALGHKMSLDVTPDVMTCVLTCVSSSRVCSGSLCNLNCSFSFPDFDNFA